MQLTLLTYVFYLMGGEYKNIIQYLEMLEDSTDDQVKTFSHVTKVYRSYHRVDGLYAGKYSYCE